MCIDGTLVTTADLYCASGLARQVIVAPNGLTPGAHTVEVRVLGTRNPASTGVWVDIDGFVILS